MTKKITHKLLGSMACLFLLVAVMVGGISVMESADSGGKHAYKNINGSVVSRVDTTDSTLRP